MAAKRKMYRQAQIYRHGSWDESKIALTFDDGPDLVWTPQVLDALKAKDVKATFFMLGKEVDRHSAVLRRMVAEGQEVGNHSYHHINLGPLPTAQISSEIEQASQTIAHFAGKRPALLRSPYGVVNRKIVQAAGNLGYHIVLWSVDPRDWQNMGADVVRDRVVNAAKNGDIVIMHCGAGPNLSGTVQALPGLIDDLRGRGFTLTTVSDLLHIPAYR